MNWSQVGHVFDTLPDWLVSSFWAPELYFHKNKYYAYYTARRKSDGVSLIGVATSKDPAKGFEDKGVLIEHGKEAIDAFVFEDEGALYISWKAYGLDNRPIELLCSRLSDDGMKLEGEPFLLLRDDDRIGMEGQCMFKRMAIIISCMRLRGAADQTAIMRCMRHVLNRSKGLTSFIRLILS